MLNSQMNQIENDGRVFIKKCKDNSKLCGRQLRIYYILEYDNIITKKN